MFRSPCCRAEMRSVDENLICAACHRAYSVADGITRFAKGESTHGEFSAAEMQEFLALAREKGWRAALDNYAHPQQKRVVQLITDPRRSRSVEMLQSVGGGRVLDFGCGYGGVSLQLSKMFDQVFSLDGSINRLGFLNIVRTQERIGNITPICHNDPANLPFPENHFSAVVLIGVMEYLPGGFGEEPPTEVHKKCMAEFLRVLRPGGRILIETKNRFGWQYCLGGKDHNGLPFGPVLPVGVADFLLRKTRGVPYRIVNHSMGGYRNILSAAGFSNIDFYWPIPGYQRPDYVLNLGRDLPAGLRTIKPNYYSSGKAMVLKSLAAANLLKYFVPHYTITADKPKTEAQPSLAA